MSSLLMQLTVVYRRCELSKSQPLARTQLASKNNTATGSFCMHLLGELDCRGEETPKPRTGAAYIGLGEACLTPGLLSLIHI